MSVPRSIKVLAFDIFGTIVDWRGTITREAPRHCRTGRVDWHVFAGRWTARYSEFVRSGRWQPLSEVLCRAGDETAAEFGVTPDDPDAFRWLWGELEPWPDVTDGLYRFQEQGHRIAALSNADTILVEMLSGFGWYLWDVVIGNEQVKAYKPDRRVYEHAVNVLGVDPGEILMVAAHLYDLQAARDAGFRTAFIRRPGEEHGNPVVPYVDVIADDLADLNVKLQRGMGSLGVA